MISRRMIRIKVLQLLYAYYSSPEKSIQITEKELRFALEKTFDLYHYLLSLLIEMADFAERRIDTNLAKHVPTFEDLHPNSRFIDNKIIGLVSKNRSLKFHLNRSKPPWVKFPELIKDLYNFLTEKEFYKEYMNKPFQSFTEDRKFVEKVYQNIILISEDLYIVLEEESIYWNDDLDLVVAMVIKTLKNFDEKSDESESLLTMYKDAEDERFAKELYRKAIINHDELIGLIHTHSSNWDVERIAFMDILIMQLALAEFLYFPSIPTKVTLNEYIELSKYYSTDKSRNFINGILDKALKELKQEQKVMKTGRGLIGENE
jgi:transcription antitermination protein NusB